MGRSCIPDHQSNRFAVYCGAGVYIKAVKHDGHQSIIETGPLSIALSASRSVAIGAVHSARRAGLHAWMVQHPAHAIGCNYGAGALV